MGPKKRTAIIRRHRRGETANRYTYTLHGADRGYLSGYATVMGGYAIPTASWQRGKHPAHTWLGRVAASVTPTTQQSREKSRLCNVVTIILSEMS